MDALQQQVNDLQNALESAETEVHEISATTPVTQTPDPIHVVGNLIRCPECYFTTMGGRATTMDNYRKHYRQVMIA